MGAPGELAGELAQPASSPAKRAILEAIRFE